MNGNDLSFFIEKITALNKFYDGVFSINTMPKSLKKRHFFFANIDLNHGIGSHWICILKNDKNELEVFDSLGLTDVKREWFLKHCSIKSSKYLRYNITPVQSILSNTCGKFVLYFIFKRLLNIDLSFNFLLNEIFEENVENNEIIITSFYNDMN